MEFFVGLVCLLLSVVVVAVIGHGLWLLGATVFGGGSQKRERDQPLLPCPKCKSPAAVMNGRCILCGAVPSLSPREMRAANRETTREFLLSLRRKDLISQELYEQMFAAILRDGRGELGPASAATQAAAPAREPISDAAAVQYINSDGAAPVDRGEIFTAEVVEEPIPMGAPPAPAESPGLYVAPYLRKPPAAPSKQPASQSVHPLDRPTEPPKPLPPPVPRRALADIVQSFFEEKNIRLGEILAGLFIVISSVGLIISLKSTLQRIPYFPAFLFLSFTLAFHGAGLYSLRKWKLQTVSHVVLIISLLLVPLSFAAAIVFSQRPAGQELPLAPMFWVVLAMGVAGGAWVTWSSTRELAPRSALPWTVAIVLASLAQVMIDRLLSPASSTGEILAWGGLPTLACLIGLGSVIWLGLRRKHFGLPHSREVLLVAGTTLFAWLVAMVVLITQVGPGSELFARLTPLLSLVALATTACGVFWQQRTTAQSLAVWRTAAIAVAVSSSASLLVWLVLAWPRPELLLILALVDAAALAAIAWSAGFPILYGVAWTIAGFGLLVAMHGLQGRWPTEDVAADPVGRRLISTLWAGRSAILLTAWGLAAGVIGWQMLLIKKRLTARTMMLAAAVLALLSFVIAASTGFLPALAATGDPSLATPVFLAIAAAIYWIARKLNGRVATKWRGAVVAALAMLWCAFIHAFWKCEPIREFLYYRQLLPDRPVILANLLQSLACIALALAGVKSKLWGDDKPYRKFRGSVAWAWMVEPPLAMSVLAAAVSLPWLFWLRWEALPSHVGGFWIVAVVLFCVAYLLRDQRWLLGGQVAAQLAIAISVALAWRVPVEGWRSLVTADHGAAQVLALAAAAIAWRALRMFSSPLPITSRLLRPWWGSWDRVLVPLAVGLLLLVAMLNVIPEAGRELGFPPEYDLTTAARNNLTTNFWIWGALAITALAVGWMVAADRSLEAGASAILFGTTVAGILATGWLEEVAIASAARWLVAVMGLVSTTFFVAREPLSRLLPWSGASQDGACNPPHVFSLRTMALTLLMLPLLGLTIVAVAQGVAQVPLGGPLVGTFFERMGMSLNYATPLIAAVVVFLAFAVRERAAVFAFGGYLVHELAVNLALLLWYVHHPQTPAEVLGALVLQVNALASGGYVLLWCGLAPWLTDARPLRQALLFTRRKLVWLDIPWWTTILLTRALLAWAVGVIAVGNWWWGPLPNHGQLGHWLSYAVVLLTAGVAVIRIANAWNWLARLAVMFVASLTIVVAATVLNQVSAEAAHQTLAWGWIVEALIGVTCLWLLGRPRDPQLPSDNEPPVVETALQHFATALSPWCTAVLLLASLLLITSPRIYLPWQLGCSLLGIALGLAAIGVHRRRQWLAFASSGMFVVGLLEWTWWQSSRPGANLITAMVWGLIGASVAWLLAEVILQRRRDQMFDPGWRFVPVHRVTMWNAFAVNLLRILPLLAFAWLPYPARLGDIVDWPHWLPIVEVLATLLLFAALTLDRTSRSAIPGAYVCGLLLMLWLVEVSLWYAPFDQAWSRPAIRAASHCLGIATFVLLASRTWQMGVWWSAIGQQLGVSDPVGGLSRANRWLPIGNLALAGLATAWSIVLVLVLQQRELRLAAAFPPAIAALGVACLTQPPRRATMQYSTLLLLAIAVILFGWADLDPRHSADFWLLRSIRLLLALGVVTFLYSLAVPKWFWRSGDWSVVFRRAGAGTGVAAVAALVAVLILEFSLFTPGVGVPISVPQITIVAVVLVGLIAALVTIALTPAADPWQLSEDQRMFYVYAAEAVAVMLFAHLYLTRPYFFDSTLRPYWPFIIIVLAFVGVGLGEMFRRLKLRVLHEPLLNTSMFLPVIPAIGFWFVASQTEYSSVLFLVGLVYVSLAYTRQSFAAGVAAAAAGNGALWALLARNEGLGFIVHPQFWLIPPALSVLVAAHLQRHRMGSEATAAIRYGALLVIYLSSSSEMFLRGIGESLWPPIVLALLSLAGVAAGVVLRIRAFLYLGTTFVVLSLISMVWHAARAIEHVWPWWAFGIGMGILLLALFGLYEKRKADAQRLLQKLRQWER